MSLKYGILSLLAFFVVLLLAFENYNTWTHPVDVRPERGVTKKPVEKMENLPAAAGQKEATADIQSYIFISQNNIFTPERKEFPVIASPSAEQVKKPIVRPKITLYGVTLAGDFQLASVSDERPRMKGERETRSVKVGDPIGEFKVAKIMPDRIVMEATEDSFEVFLYDARAPKQRAYVKTDVKPAAVTSTSTVPAPPAPQPPTAAPPSVPAPAPRATPAPAVPQPTAPATPTTSAQPFAPLSSRTRRGQPQPMPQPSVPAQPAQPNVPSQP